MAARSGPAARRLRPPAAVALLLPAVLLLPPAGVDAREHPHPGTVIPADDSGLFLETEGSGPPIVLLPAAPGLDHGYFHPYLTSLAAHATVVYYDPRGCGRSAAGPPGAYGLEPAVADLERARLRLGREQIDLLGHGYGAAVAILYAGRHPERVGRLILIGPTPRASTFLDAAGLRGALTGRMREAIAALEGDRYLSADGRLRERIRILAPLLFHRLTDRSFHGAFVDGMTVSAAPYDAAAASIEGPDLLPALGRLRQPILIVAGRHDRTASPDDVEAVRRAAPSARLSILEESGSMPFADQPVEFLKTVRAFLEETAGRVAGAGGGI
ncbi:MAG: alpha/beta fold hydrolase [Candidatus Polarisedimenticolia bacterium]